VDTVTGPVELAVLAFPGSRFRGEIAPALADLVENGIVSILDLIVVRKDEDGSVTSVELADLDAEVQHAFDQLDGEVSGLLSEDDLRVAGELLQPGSTAAVIVWENTWARRLSAAVSGAGGFIVAHDRIDAETVSRAVAFDNQQMG
jgi:uncharacterized membrane protein